MLEMHEMERGPYHYKEVYPHTLKVLDRTPDDLVLRWAGLLHDIAKPRTYSITDGEVHFFGHDKLGANMAREILDAPAPARRGDRAGGAAGRRAPAHRHLRRELDRRGGAPLPARDRARHRAPVRPVPGRHDLVAPADVAAALARVDALYRRCEEIKAQEDVEKLSSPLDGHELMACSAASPGRWIGQVKDYLLGLVLDGQLSQDDKETAERLAREYVAAHPELGIGNEKSEIIQKGVMEPSHTISSLPFE